MTALVLSKLRKTPGLEIVFRPGWWILPSVIGGAGIWFQIGKALLG